MLNNATSVSLFCLKNITIEIKRHAAKKKKTQNISHKIDMFAIFHE